MCAGNLMLGQYYYPCETCKPAEGFHIFERRAPDEDNNKEKRERENERKKYVNRDRKASLENQRI